jgi:hypothetical protein
MEWNEDHRKFAKQVLLKLGRKISPQHLAFLFKRHMGVDVSPALTDELIQELNLVSPQASFAPIPPTPKQRDLRHVCTDIINEAKGILQKEGLHTVQSEPTLNGLSPILCLSDLHFGEIIRVNDTVVFDLTEANARLDNIIDQFIQAPELDGYNVDECVVILAGDIIDGEMIYPAQSFDTQGHAYNQIKDATTSIWKALLKLSATFPKVRVHCVPGNHGRTTKHHHPMTNWDNALYFGLQLCANIAKTNIEIHTPLQMWADFKVRGWGVHTRHIGVVQASTAGPAKRVMTWLDNHDANLFFYGHYHCPEMFSSGTRRIFKNGSLPPANDFAENLGFLDGIGQWMVGVSDRDPVAFSKILMPMNL